MGTRKKILHWEALWERKRNSGKRGNEDIPDRGVLPKLSGPAQPFRKNATPHFFFRSLMCFSKKIFSKAVRASLPFFPDRPDDNPLLKKGEGKMLWCFAGLCYGELGVFSFVFFFVNPLTKAQREKLRRLGGLWSCMRSYVNVSDEEIKKAQPFPHWNSHYTKNPVWSHLSVAENAYHVQYLAKQMRKRCGWVGEPLLLKLDGNHKVADGNHRLRAVEYLARQGIFITVPVLVA